MLISEGRETNKTMNKVINAHVKASEVPQRFRQGIDDASLVTVIVQQESISAEAPSRARLADLIRQAREAAEGITTEEAVLRIRSLRDEWDD